MGLGRRRPHSNTVPLLAHPCATEGRHLVAKRKRVPADHEGPPEPFTIGSRYIRACGRSSDSRIDVRPRLPVSLSAWRTRASGSLRANSPITAAGPSRIYTAFRDAVALKKVRFSYTDTLGIVNRFCSEETATPRGHGSPCRSQHLGRGAGQATGCSGPAFPCGWPRLPRGSSRFATRAHPSEAARQPCVPTSL